jgi:hypothetical protein
MRLSLDPNKLCVPKLRALAATSSWKLSKSLLDIASDSENSVDDYALTHQRTKMIMKRLNYLIFNLYTGLFFVW